MGRPRKMRIAVYGGDSRVERLEWPDHLDVRHFEYGSPNSSRRLADSAKSGSLDHVVILTKYMGHADYSRLKDLGVPVTHFSRSPMQLSRDMAVMFPPVPASDEAAHSDWNNPLLRPSRQPVTPARSGMLPTEVPELSTSDPPTSVVVDESDATLEAPPPITLADAFPSENESLGEALRRLTKRDGISQSDLARMIGKPQSTVSRWFLDRARPVSMAPLIDLWGELSRFSAGPRGRPSLSGQQTAGPSVAHESVVPLPASAAPPIPTPPPKPEAPLSDRSLLELVLAWRRAKHRAEEAQRELQAVEARIMQHLDDLPTG